MEDCLTVNIGSINSGSRIGLLRSWIDGNIWPSEGFEHAACVGGRVLERCITVNGADSKKLQRWVMDGQEDGKGILIRIERILSALH